MVLLRPDEAPDFRRDPDTRRYTGWHGA